MAFSDEDMAKIYPDWHRMTEAQRRDLGIAYIAELAEELVAQGKLRKAGTDDQGRQLYELNVKH